MRIPKLALIGVAGTMLLTGCGFHGLYGVQLPGGTDLGSHPYTLTVYFDDVLDLVPQSSVKVNDVSVGEVVKVSLSSSKDDTGAPATDQPGWIAKVEIKVRGDVHLPANARAAVQQTSLLGEKYVALEQPLDKPSTTELRSGDSIKVPNTTTAPAVEDVLGALGLLLNDGGLQQLGTITKELNKALNGNQDSVRDLISQLNTFVGTLDVQKSDITAALDSLDSLSTTLARQTDTIAKSLDTLPKALAILAQDRSKLTTLLVSLSNLGSVASDVITQTDTELTSALKNLSPALQQLTAAGANLPKALRVAGTFPFPLGKTLEAVKGDYANLHLLLNLNLTDELCGVSKGLCLTSGALPLSSASTAAQESADTVFEPTLLGLSG
jgi:phospholipid/cholesterol/gamma-HCH transport system substrate-binding protein